MDKGLDNREVGRSGSGEPSGCQPSASAPLRGSSQSGIPNAAALLDLAARCCAVSAPSREIDEAIEREVKTHGWATRIWTAERQSDVAQRYTASLDAALSLVPANSHVLLNGYNAENFWNRARVQTFKQEVTPDDSKAASLPLALCAAALRARAASGIVAAEGGRDPKGLDERSEQSPAPKGGDAQ